MKIIKTFLIITLFSFHNVYADNKVEFENWKDQFKSQALSNDISEKTIDMVMTNVKFLPKVIEYDRFQPEFMKILKHIFQKDHQIRKLKRELNFILRI